MLIKVIKVEVEDKGKYQQLKVTYDDLVKNRVASKTLLSFNYPEVYRLLSAAKDGDMFDISGLTKNAKGYWDWTMAAIADSNSQAPASAPKAGNTTTTARSSYETSEERAQRQVYIVRQSSLSNAIETLATGKAAVKPEDVIALAKKYEAYVFGTPANDVLGIAKDKLEEEFEVE